MSTVKPAPHWTFAVEQRFQVAVLTDLCNECGTCVTACPTAGRPYVDKPRLYLHREDFEAQDDNAFRLRDGDHIEGRFDGATHRLEVGHGRDEGRLVYRAPGLHVVLDQATFQVLEAMTEGVAPGGGRVTDGARSLEPAAVMATLLSGICWIPCAPAHGRFGGRRRNTHPGTRPGVVGTANREPSRRARPSYAEKVWVPVNGLPQGMFITGRNSDGPVLLFLHGGPGMPEYWLTRRYPIGLERHFIVAWWEQRGAGLSYRRGIPAETMTLEQFVADTLEVTDYLRRRFGRDRIYLMGHSWGSYVGIQVAAREPARFHAYIGVAQISHQIRSERLSHEYLLERYRERGDRGMVRRLENVPLPLTVPLPAAYDAVRDKAMHQLGVGTTRDMRSVVRGLFLPSWRFPEYTLREKLGLWRGKRFSRRSTLWDQMLATDLTSQVTHLDIPAYFLHGIHDRTVSYALARSYAASLAAPLVGFYSFDASAHSPMFEEPDRTLRILAEDVLGNTTELADADRAKPSRSRSGPAT